MGIKFTCPHCNTALNVKSELGGKRGRCPSCQQKIEIPTESKAGAAAPTAAATQPGPSAPSVAAPRAGAESSAGTPAAFSPPTESPAADHLESFPALQTTTGQPGGQQAGAQAAPAAQTAAVTQPAAAAQPAAGIQPAVGTAPVDAISESPQLQWYVMPPGATSQYGPAVGEEFRAWIKEGRVTADTLIWRQDWPEWKPAGMVFPELQAAYTAPVGAPAAAPIAPAGYAIPTAAGALPTAVGAAPMAFSLGGEMNPIGAAAAGGFPVGAPTSPTATSGRRGPYRARSNTAPMVMIGILVVAMIPLSYFVWKVVRDQFAETPPPAASPAKPAE
jgi:uncharacterized protein DUF4339